MSKKSRKNRTNRTNKTRKKIYGADKYLMYNIHKTSQISYNPEASCKAIQNILGKNNVSKIHSPPDKALAKRGIKWVRCLKGMKAEFHFVKPYKISHDKMLRKIIKEEDHFKSPYQTQFLENHIGMYVPDLTPVIKAVLKYKYNYFLARRADGLNHLYVNVPGTLNYLELDSTKLDIKSIPNVEQHDFTYANYIGRKLERQFKRKTLRRRNSKRRNKSRRARSEVYTDPNHNMTRKVTYLEDNNIKITGKDSVKGKRWSINGKVDKNNNAILDFSSKGGPKNIRAKFRKKEIEFGDGNIWKRI
jgi:hypothetical protein